MQLVDRTRPCRGLHDCDETLRAHTAYCIGKCHGHAELGTPGPLPYRRPYAAVLPSIHTPNSLLFQKLCELIVEAGWVAPS